MGLPCAKQMKSEVLAAPTICCLTSCFNAATATRNRPILLKVSLKANAACLYDKQPTAKTTQTTAGVRKSGCVDTAAGTRVQRCRSNVNTLMHSRESSRAAAAHEKSDRQSGHDKATICCCQQPLSPCAVRIKGVCTEQIDVQEPFLRLDIDPRSLAQTPVSPSWGRGGGGVRARLSG